MIKIEFTKEEIENLDYERYHHPHPKVQKRMEILYLKSQRLSHKEICRLCHISKTTLVIYLKNYRDGGVEALKRLGYKGNPSELNAHKDRLKNYFREHPPRNTAEAQAAIEKLTGIKRSPTQTRAFLKRIGMKVRKVGFVPEKITEPVRQRQQEEFIQNSLQPCLDEAQEGKRTVFSLMPHILFMALSLGLYGVLSVYLFHPRQDASVLMF